MSSREVAPSFMRMPDEIVGHYRWLAQGELDRASATADTKIKSGHLNKAAYYATLAERVVGTQQISPVL